MDGLMLGLAGAALAAGLDVLELEVDPAHLPDELAAIEFLTGKMKDTKTNAKFFDAMKR